jgi:tetratricopeptide (TPR) repeat protein
MSTAPIIFISYAHADEPEKPAEGEVQWLTFVCRYLRPAVKGGVFELWVDRYMMGGTDWDPEIERKLRACDIFILLVSVNSMASDYIIDKEIAIIRERQANGDDVHFYPLLLTPTPDAGLRKVRDKNLRPRDAKPLFSFHGNDRLQHMTEAANEIAVIAQQIVDRKGALETSLPLTRPAYVHITGLPETTYERLVGRERELHHLDDAWADGNANILSLIAEGGTGKSALVNEWLQRLQADNYRGAAAVIGWSFYSQGSKDRATSAEPFLDWALGKLDIRIDTTSAIRKGEAIADAMTERRVLLILDGVEPLQHSLDSQQGELKDPGLRALLRRFAAIPPATEHGLVVLTSRLAVKDIARRKYGAAPILDVEQLSDEAGVALLRDNGVWGIDSELKTATKAFGGHPLALGLLASFLKETQYGDVRRRDHIRAYLADKENPRHDHAGRVMETYEKEWLTAQPVYQAIMSIIGLFDRPASGDCLISLRTKPAIEGLTDALVDLDDDQWMRALTRLRDLRLLSPEDRSAPDAIDAHPLVREYFGARLEETNGSAWRAAHGRLYEHLRDTTREGDRPSISGLGPLYQAIAHGCRAGLHQNALDEVYRDRICRRRSGRVMFYSTYVLGAIGSDLAAMSWFFDRPYETPVATLSARDRSWVLATAGVHLVGQGRLNEAIPAHREALRAAEADKDWSNAAAAGSNLCRALLVVGEVTASIVTAQRAITHADQGEIEDDIVARRTSYAAALHAAGRYAEAEEQFADAERRQKKSRPRERFLYSSRGHQYCDLLMSNGNYLAARDRATKTIAIARQNKWIRDIGLDTLTIGRAHFGLACVAMVDITSKDRRRDYARTARTHLDEAMEGLRAYGDGTYIVRGLFGRAAFRRSVGDWDGTVRDLNEVEEIAEPGPMKLCLCDVALERVRLAFAQIEAFAPLSGLIDNGPPKPQLPSETERNSLHDEAAKQLAIAADYIETCGYHRRDEELAELQTVLKGERAYAGLQPRV